MQWTQLLVQESQLTDPTMHQHRSGAMAARAVPPGKPWQCTALIAWNGAGDNATAAAHCVASRTTATAVQSRAGHTPCGAGKRMTSAICASNIRQPVLHQSTLPCCCGPASWRRGRNGTAAQQDPAGAGHHLCMSSHYSYLPLPPTPPTPPTRARTHRHTHADICATLQHTQGNQACGGASPACASHHAHSEILNRRNRCVASYSQPGVEPGLVKPGEPQAALLALG